MKKLFSIFFLFLLITLCSCDNTDKNFNHDSSSIDNTNSISNRDIIKDSKDKKINISSNEYIDFKDIQNENIELIFKGLLFTKKSSEDGYSSFKVLFSIKNISKEPYKMRNITTHAFYKDVELEKIDYKISDEIYTDIINKDTDVINSFINKDTGFKYYVPAEVLDNLSELKIYVTVNNQIYQVKSKPTDLDIVVEFLDAENNIQFAVSRFTIALIQSVNSDINTIAEAVYNNHHYRLDVYENVEKIEKILKNAILSDDVRIVMEEQLKMYSKIKKILENYNRPDETQSIINELGEQMNTSNWKRIDDSNSDEKYLLRDLTSN